MNLTKEEKILKLKNKKITFEDFSINIINKLYDEYIEEEKMKTVNVDKSTTKYKILLEFVNKLLKNIGKEEINDLTDFKDIDRGDILKAENKLLLISMKNKLFPLYNKQKCGYYSKTKGYTFNVLKGMCKELGLTIEKKRKQTSKHCVVTARMLYSITE